MKSVSQICGRSQDSFLDFNTKIYEESAASSTLKLLKEET
jgi:hypothetical protein